MRIVLLCDWFLPRLGGLELHLRDLAGELDARGHEVHVVTSTPADPALQGRLQTASPGVAPGVRVHRLEVALLPAVGLVRSPAVGRLVASSLRRIGPDVVHVHAGLVPPLALAGAHAADRLGLPVVMTFHSVMDRARLAWHLADRLLGWSEWADVVSAVGPGVAAEAARILDEEDVRVLPNGVDPAAWAPDPSTGDPSPPDRSTPYPPPSEPSGIAPSSPGRLRLVSVMRLQPRKRGRALLGIVAAAARRLEGEVALSLTVIGDGPERAALERKARRLGIDDRVSFTGYLPRSDLGRRFARADAFVTASILESFGLSALEARCAGLPVVARSDSGVSAHVEHGREGLLAPDDAGLIDHLVTLARSRPLLDRIRTHNRSAPTPFAWPAVIARHIESYADALLRRASDPVGPAADAPASPTPSGTPAR